MCVFPIMISMGENTNNHWLFLAALFRGGHTTHKVHSGPRNGSNSDDDALYE